jgi:hypothetical protein
VAAPPIISPVFSCLAPPPCFSFALLLLLICLLGCSTASNSFIYLFSVHRSLLLLLPFFRYGSFALFPSLVVRRARLLDSIMRPNVLFEELRRSLPWLLLDRSSYTLEIPFKRDHRLSDPSDVHTTIWCCTRNVSVQKCLPTRCRVVTGWFDVPPGYRAGLIRPSGALHCTAPQALFFT